MYAIVSNYLPLSGKCYTLQATSHEARLTTGDFSHSAPEVDRTKTLLREGLSHLLSYSLTSLLSTTLHRQLEHFRDFTPDAVLINR